MQEAAGEEVNKEAESKSRKTDPVQLKNRGSKRDV